VAAICVRSRGVNHGNRERHILCGRLKGPDRAIRHTARLEASPIPKNKLNFAGKDHFGRAWCLSGKRCGRLQRLPFFSPISPIGRSRRQQPGVQRSIFGRAFRPGYLGAASGELTYVTHLDRFLCSFAKRG